MSIHGTNTPILLADVLAQFGSDPVIAKAIDQDLPATPVIVLILDIFLESCCKVGIGAIPADVGAGVVVLPLPTLLGFSTHSESTQQVRLPSPKLPKAASAVLCPRCPNQVILAPLHLDYLIMVSLDRLEAGQGQLLPLPI